MPTFVNGRPARRMPDLAPEVLRGVPRRITEHGEAILHRPCTPVTEYGAARWSTLIDDMFTTLWIAEGCGLAANQVDVDARLFVYDLTDEHGDRHVGHVFNPHLASLAGLAGEQTSGEGCLSVPGANEQLARPARVTLRGFDLEGRPLTIDATNYLARCLIHETQHLDGILYVDHLAPATRQHAMADSVSQRAAVLDRRTTRQHQLSKQI